MLKDPLSKVTGKEERICVIWCDRREEAEFGRAKILRLVNDDMIERLGRFLTGLRKKGDTIMRVQRKDGASYYRIGKAQATAAFEPDFAKAASATSVDAIDTATSAGAA